MVAADHEEFANTKKELEKLKKENAALKKYRNAHACIHAPHTMLGISGEKGRGVGWRETQTKPCILMVCRSGGPAPAAPSTLSSEPAPFKVSNRYGDVTLGEHGVHTSSNTRTPSAYTQIATHAH